LECPRTSRIPKELGREKRHLDSFLSVDELLTLLFFFTNRDTETIFRKTPSLMAVRPAVFIMLLQVRLTSFLIALLRVLEANMN
jgi:hypothetical protein